MFKTALRAPKKISMLWWRESVVRNYTTHAFCGVFPYFGTFTCFECCRLCDCPTLPWMHAFSPLFHVAPSRSTLQRELPSHLPNGVDTFSTSPISKFWLTNKRGWDGWALVATSYHIYLPEASTLQVEHVGMSSFLWPLSLVQFSYASWSNHLIDAGAIVGTETFESLVLQPSSS